MIELEVYAAGLRNLNKVLELDHEFQSIAGLRLESMAITVRFVSNSTIHD
jgi:hypothetical protein